MADNFSDIKVSQLDAFLQKFPKLDALLKENAGVSFSSFEIMLPIILDNFDEIKTNIEAFANANRKNAFGQIVIWLKDNGYIVDNKFANKDISVADLTNFAAFYCNTLFKNNLISTQVGSLKDAASGATELAPNFFNKQFDIEGLINDNGEQVSLSLHDGISKLRSKQILYSDTTDKVLRDLVVDRFNIGDSKLIGVDPSGKSVFFGSYVNTQITNNWNKLIHKEDVVKKLLSIPELQEEAWVNKNVDAISFYEHLKECVKNNVGNLKDDAEIKNIVDNFDPRSVLFLTQKLEDTATKNYVPDNRYKDTKIFAGLIDDVKKHISKIGFIIKKLELKEPGSMSEKIYDSREDTFTIPKPTTSADTGAFKQLLVSDINIDEDSIKQRIDALDDQTLYSIDHNLANPYTESYLIKWFTTLFTKKVLAEQYGFTAVEKGNELVFRYSGEEKTDASDSLSAYLSKLRGIIKKYKDYLAVLKYIVKSITSGKYNFDTSELATVNASSTQLYLRGYLNTFSEKLENLAEYSESENLDDVNFKSIVNSDVLQKFVLDVEVMAANTLLPINDDLEEIASMEYKKFKTAQPLDKEEFNAIYKEKQQEAELFIQSIKSYVNEKLNNLQTTPTEAVEDLDLYLGKYSNFINALTLKREAAHKFDESDLVDFFKELYGQQYDNTTKTLSVAKQSLLSEVYNIENVAESIIEFLNLKNVKDINKVQIGAYINQLVGLNKYATYRNILIQNIDLDFLQENLTSVIDAIYSKLNSQNTQLSYNDILKEILSFNKDLNTNENLDDSDLSKFIKDNNISTLSSENISASEDAEALISFVANILFKTYRKTLEDSKSVSLIDYIDNQKFNLLVDICDALSANKTLFTERVTSAIQFMKNKEYLLNAENKFDRLSEQFLYRGEPQRVIQAISNYKVLSNARAILFNIVNSDPVLANLMEDCTDWDFSDKLVGEVLKFSKIFNISGKLVDGNINDLRGNIALPLDQKYTMDNSFETKFRTIFNKLKNLSSVSINRNIIALMKVLNETQFNFKSMSRDIAKLSKKLYETNKEKGNTDSEVLKQNMTDLESTLNQINDLATESIENLRPNVEQKIQEWLTNNKNLAPYVSIKFISDRHKRGLFSREFDILPIDITVDTVAIQNKIKSSGSSVQKEISDLDRKLQKMRFLLSQYLYNATIDSNTSSETLSGLQVLLERNNNLLSSLTDKIQNSFKGEFITIPYVAEKLSSLKTDLTNYIADMSEKTNKCFDLTMEFSEQLTNLWQKVEDISAEYDLKI